MALSKLYLDLKPSTGKLTPAAARRRRMALTQRVRHLTQAGFVVLILYTSVMHYLFETAGAPSIDALCPFGALETLWRFVSTGQFVSHLHASNLVLGLALLLATLVAGGAFCGWICPFGALQDFLNWLRGKLHIREVIVPARVDRFLRYGRYLVLGLILYQMIYTVNLWFGEYDPYKTLFGLGWLFEFNLASSWIPYTIAVVVLVASLFVERAWCRFACPLGGAISLLGNFSLLRIRRTGASCKSCAVCDRPCPVKLPVAT
ncbi:MAG: 4Fe-4S binding protein, partial [Rudaea sp.]